MRKITGFKRNCEYWCSMVQKSSRNESGWQDRLSRSGFFLGALLLHLFLFIMIAGYIVYNPTPQESEPPTPTTFVAHATPVTDVPKPPVDTSSLSSLSDSRLTPPIAIIPGSGPSIHIQPPNVSDIIGKGPKGPIAIGPASSEPHGIDPRLPAIKAGPMRYRKDNPLESQSDPTNVIATFPVYVASYANGDWACNLRLDKDGNIVAGSMPDLVAKINEWSHGKIQGQVVQKPLNIGSSELLDKMPPFIFFTGHKDFVLTDQEIENLQRYLHDGGAIWGDNALAGAGSRFDVAFRREMKRVVPDKDKNFEPMSMSDDAFTKNFYRLTEIPHGMNYYAEPPLHLDIDGKLAIIYTPNDYSDMMFMRILPKDTEIYIKDVVPPNTLYTQQSFWYNRDVFFRNFDLGDSLAVHHLGMDIVAYLLVRFDDVLLLAPQ